MPYRSASDTSTPPRAVPSSLVMTRPVTPTMSRKISTWAWAFCPTVASSTSSISCGAAGSTFFSTRTIFCSSSIRSALLCSRPAVSISSTSAPSARASTSASKARPAASAAGRARQHRGSRRARPRSATARPRRRGRCRRRRAARLARVAVVAARACRSSWSCRCR